MLFMGYKGKADWETVTRLLSKIKLCATVHTYMYSPEEKYESLEVKYQINLHLISIQSFAG